MAFWESGVDPIVAGLVIGLLTCAYPAARQDLEQATDAFRLFREQPTARLAAEAREVVRSAISPNERLQERYHSWTSYVIVPLFALANADIKISGSFLAHAYTSPATLGIMIGYIVGKPIGTAGGAWLVSKVTKGRLTPPVGWGAVVGVGAVAGIGFTVSLLIASLAFNGPELAEAKLGILSGAICATGLTWVIFHGLDRLSPRTRLRALLGTSTTVTDLAVPVDPERDHIRGPAKDAIVTLVEYGDFECPYCGQAEPAVRELIREHGELRFVFRHLPLTEVHPHAQLAAEGAEAAAQAGRVLGDARHADGPPGGADRAGPRRVRGRPWPRHREVHGRPAQAHGRLADRGGRRLGRPGGGVGHADVLHQREPLLRRVRPGGAAGGGARGQGPRGPGRPLMGLRRAITGETTGRPVVKG